MHHTDNPRVCLCRTLHIDPGGWEKGGNEVWVTATCPRASCSLTVRINGVGSCSACKALLCYKASPRRRVLEFQGKDAWGWRSDPKGPERVHPQVNGKVIEERGQWVKLPGTRFVFPAKADGRRTVGTGGGWGFLDRYR